MIGGDESRAGHQQTVVARFDCVQMTTHDFAQPSLRPVTHRGLADVTAGDKGEATDRQRILGLTDYIQYE